jgi:hypothetical protein
MRSLVSLSESPTTGARLRITFVLTIIRPKILNLNRNRNLTPTLNQNLIPTLNQNLIPTLNRRWTIQIQAMIRDTETAVAQRLPPASGTPRGVKQQGTRAGNWLMKD